MPLKLSLIMQIIQLLRMEWGFNPALPDSIASAHAQILEFSTGSLTSSPWFAPKHLPFSSFTHRQYTYLDNAEVNDGIIYSQHQGERKIFLIKYFWCMWALKLLSSSVWVQILAYELCSLPQIFLICKTGIIEPTSGLSWRLNEWMPLKHCNNTLCVQVAQ